MQKRAFRNFSYIILNNVVLMNNKQCECLSVQLAKYIHGDDIHVYLIMLHD